MKKDFVTYEQALALKELGMIHYIQFAEYEDGWFSLTDRTKLGKSDNCIPAPLIQQVFRFFREKYGFRFSIGWRDLDLFKSDIYEFSIYGETRNECFIGLKKTYEEAEQACLNKLIEIAKELL